MMSMSCCQRRYSTAAASLPHLLVVCFLILKATQVTSLKQKFPELLEVLDLTKNQNDCPQDVVDDDMLNDFAKYMDMKQEEIASSQICIVQQDGSIVVHDRVYSLQGMIPVNVYSDHAEILVDGKPIATEHPCVFSKKTTDGETIVATIAPPDQDGNKDEYTAAATLDSIMIIGSDGQTTFLQSIMACGAMIQVDAKQMDVKKLASQWTIAHDDPDEKPDETRQLLDILQQTQTAKQNFGNDGRHVRQLDTTACSNNVIGVAVAVDSSFCHSYATETIAIARVEAIMEMVSTFYQVSGICETIVMTHLEMDCSGAKYDDAVSLNRSGCSSGDGLLQAFGQIWDEEKSQIPRNAAVLFSGTGLECENPMLCVIGCATYIGLCSPQSYAVTFATFSHNVGLQAVLVAHELGHVLGSPHDETLNEQFIMEAALNPSPLGFSTESRDFLSRTLQTARSLGMCQDFQSFSTDSGSSSGGKDNNKRRRRRRIRKRRENRGGNM